MEVTITARHCSVPSAIRAKALERVDRLRRYEPRAAAAVISFEKDHGEKQVEARLRRPGAPIVVARASGDTFTAALDRSVEKLERQLRRHRARIRNHRASPRTASFDAVPLPS